MIRYDPIAELADDPYRLLTEKPCAKDAAEAQKYLRRLLDQNSLVKSWRDALSRNVIEKKIVECFPVHVYKLEVMELLDTGVVLKSDVEETFDKTSLSV